MFKEIKELLQAYKERDPAATSNISILLLYPGVRAVIDHRIAHWFYKHKHFYIARSISQRSRKRTGIEIHPGAQIGKRLVIDHGMGVVIGETAVIGDDCLLYQGVTLGGSGKEKGKRHPTLGNNVLVGAGAKVLGSFTIGDNASIAANAVVLNEIPQNATAVGVPARVVRVKGQKVDMLDHIHTPDPIQQAIKQINERIDNIEGK